MEKGASFDQKLRLFNSCTQGLVAYVAPIWVTAKSTLAKADKLQLYCVADSLTWQKKDTTSWQEWTKAKKAWAGIQIKKKWSASIRKRQAAFYLHVSRHPESWPAKALQISPPKKLQI